jgi:DNA-binding NarL/FixJ family response regulator
MLRQLSKEQRECLDRALECRTRADLTADGATKKTFLDMEQRWLRLGRSYEYMERLDLFLNGHSARKPRQETTQFPIRVVIVESDNNTRAILSQTFETDSECEVIAEFRDGLTALAAIPQIAPGLVVVDLFLPDELAIKIIRKVSASCPECKIFAIASAGNDEIVDQALDAGADGYLLKESTAEEFRQDILAMRGAEPMIAREIPSPALSELNDNDLQRSPQVAMESLTRRETEVLELIAKGHSYNKAAVHCGVSCATVHSHLKNVYRKLEAHSKTEAIYIARVRGIIP